MRKPNRGGRGGSEPRARVLTRQARAWELSMHGHSQRAIAQELGVSQPAVSRMLKRAGAEVMREVRVRTELHLARHLGQLDVLFQEIARAWEESKGERIRRRHQRVDRAGGTPAAGGATTTTEAVMTTVAGDPRYSAQWLRVLQEKGKILQRVGAERPPMPEVPMDPYASVKQKLQALADDDLATLSDVNLKKMLLPERTRLLLKDLTPGELIAMGRLMKEDMSGDDES